MVDGFAGFQVGPSDPARSAFAITPNDSNDLSTVPRALYIGATGDLKVTTSRGSTVTFTNVPAGFFPVSVSRVFATGTTALGIIGVY